MTTQEALDHFGGYKELAQALDIWPNVIYRWGKHPPPSRQYEIEVKSGGKLKAQEK